MKQTEPKSFLAGIKELCIEIEPKLKAAILSEVVTIESGTPDIKPSSLNTVRIKMK